MVESAEAAYWARMDEMKALVEPLPLVPAICIGLNRSKLAGFPAVSCCP